MPHQQLLRKHASTAINRHFPFLLPPSLQSRHDILEQRRGVGAAGVPVFPQIALQVLVVGGFDVAGGQVADVGFERGGRGAVLGRESVAVWSEFIGVPLGGEDGGKGGEGVRELLKREEGYLVFLVSFLLRVCFKFVENASRRKKGLGRVWTLLDRTRGPTRVSFTNEIGQIVPSTWQANVSFRTLSSKAIQSRLEESG